MTGQALLSPSDSRDYRISRAMDLGTELPKELAVWQPPVQNQGYVGNCVAQVIANIKECWLHRREYEHKDFSVGFIYGWKERDYSGMYCRDALAQVVGIGDCLAADFEANVGIPKICEMVAERREELQAKAAEYRAQSYLHLFTKDELRAFIYKYRVPLLIVVDAADIDLNQSVGSYHALAAYGWEDDGQTVLFTNSWGEQWGTGGKGKINFSKILEIWGLIEMDNSKFTDIAGHWAEEDIRTAAEDGILKGFPDDTFQPDKPLTRAELAAIYARFKKQLGE